MRDKDAQYLEIMIAPVKTCAHYRPAFGQGRTTGLTLSEFQTLYKGDKFYSWIGLDNPMMYAAHKAAGGMTSIYRQVGIGCERLFRQILMDSLGLDAAEVQWGYSLPVEGKKDKKLKLDGRIPLAAVEDSAKRAAIKEWMRAQAKKLGVAAPMFNSLSGSVFEVRQGYKSKDSKRQNADIANAATAYVKGYLPCATIFSAQIDRDIVTRYRLEKWAVLTGTVGDDDPTASTYDFARDVIGYDLAAFFTRNSPAIRKEIDAVLDALLAPKTT